MPRLNSFIRGIEFIRRRSKFYHAAELELSHGGIRFIPRRDKIYSAAGGQTSERGLGLLKPGEGAGDADTELEAGHSRAAQLEDHVFWERNGPTAFWATSPAGPAPPPRDSSAASAASSLPPRALFPASHLRPFCSFKSAPASPPSGPPRRPAVPPEPKPPAAPASSSPDRIPKPPASHRQRS